MKVIGHQAICIYIIIGFKIESCLVQKVEVVILCPEDVFLVVSAVKNVINSAFFQYILLHFWCFCFGDRIYYMLLMR